MSPTTYQGGKHRIAAAILDRMGVEAGDVFCDLCCGSGAVSIELVKRGHSPDHVVMLDWGPWGIFWNRIGYGTFSLDRFREYCNMIPSDIDKVQGFIKDLSKQPVDADAPYVFLLLQAASFGGKAIWIEGGRWRNCSFRNHWKPTATSSRRSPVNPMMPMPKTLLERVEVVADRMKGVRGMQCEIEMYKPPTDAVVYIDPPYLGTTQYGHTFDVVKYATSLQNAVYVSEGKPLSETAYLITGAKERRKGGISGVRGKANEEWLSKWN